MRILKLLLIIISISLLIVSINSNVVIKQHQDQDQDHQQQDQDQNSQNKETALKEQESNILQQSIDNNNNNNNINNKENEKKITNSFLSRKQLKYNVVLNNNNKDNKKIINNENYNNNDNNNNNKNEEFNHIEMTSKDGSKYKCLIPKPVEKAKEEWIEIPSNEKIRESLLPLKQKCIKSINPAIWWSYEFCYLDKVRQMHLEKGVATSEFILGVYNDDKSDSNGSIKGIDQNILDKYRKKEITEIPSTPSSHASTNLPYFSEIYEDGTDCEILNIKRHTEVRYYCSKDAVQPTWSDISEPSSCTYLLKILTNKMCIHPIFQPKVDKALDIKCTKI